MMNVLLILVVQLVSLSLGRAQSTTNQPDDGDQQHQVSAQIELETTDVDDSFFPSDQSVVGSMETDATYHRRYYYPTNYNTYSQNIRRPYYFNRYPQNNNYRPAYRPYTPGAGYLNNVFSSIISQALASGNPIEHNIDLNNKGNYDNIAVSLLTQAQAAGVPLIYNPNVDISDK